MPTIPQDRAIFIWEEGQLIEDHPGRNRDPQLLNDAGNKAAGVDEETQSPTPPNIRPERLFFERGEEIGRPDSEHRAGVRGHERGLFCLPILEKI